MKNKISLSFFLFSTVIFLFSCRKEPLNGLEAGENLVYITSRDSTVNMANYSTFRIVDSVLIQEGNRAGYSSNSNDRAFINAVKQNMIQRGFTEAKAATQVDLGLKVSLVINTSQGIVSIPGIWGGWDPFFWGGGFDPGWGWGVGPGWGWGGGGLATYEVREGIMNIDIFDIKNAALNNQLTIIWNGIIRGGGVYDGSQAEVQVRQLFEQSPYIKR